jgi:cell division cycle 20, cofactor of APC complex
MSATLSGAMLSRVNGSGAAASRNAQVRLASSLSANLSKRALPSVPSKVLDAPDIVDDYYLNVLSWSRSNVVAVALRDSVYLWNATTSSIDCLCQTDDERDYVSSVRWSPDGTKCAIGTASAQLQIWCAETKRLVAVVDDAHQARISALAWNPVMGRNQTLVSGGRDSQLLQHDLRMLSASSPNATVRLGSAAPASRMHAQEVCGLAFNDAGTTLASGGNDNLLQIWSAARLDRPMHVLRHHEAAVKALAWCPWQSNLLASGGGTADRCIRFWNADTGASLNKIDTKSQVCAIQWSVRRRELISSHGFSLNQLIVWNYPSMSKVGELTGHTSRVLHMERSPDGRSIVSAAGDETIRFWDVWGGGDDDDGDQDQDDENDNESVTLAAAAASAAAASVSNGHRRRRRRGGNTTRRQQRTPLASPIASPSRFGKTSAINTSITSPFSLR